MGTTEIKFLLDESNFIQKYEKKRARNGSFDLLIISCVPTVIDGFLLMSKEWFKSKVIGDRNLIGICFEIHTDLAENISSEPKFSDFANKDTFMIVFQSKTGGQSSKIFWKIQSSQNFYSLLIENDENGEVSEYVQDFLMGEIQKGETGVRPDYQSKATISLQEVGDEYGCLLLEATNNVESPTVRKLLKYGLDPDNAIDTAWLKFKPYHGKKKEAANNIILDLLNANSRLPAEFKYHDASDEVRKFVDMCESLHLDIQQGNSEALEEKMSKNSNLVHFYDRENQSLLFYALKINKFEIFKFLNKGITVGAHEDLSIIYKSIPRDHLQRLRDIHSVNAVEFPESHILKLRSLTKLCNNEKMCYKKWKYITEAYKVMSLSPFHDKMMKIVAECRNLEIYLDTKHDTNHYLHPSSRSTGTIYGSNTIYVGAKHLMDEKLKYNVIGVLAREFCHLATKIAFMNPKHNPYPMDESSMKTQYLDVVMKQCTEHQDQCEFIKNVFSNYSKEYQEIEMIATVPEMLMVYLKKPEILNDQKETFTELFDYAINIVESEYERCLPVFKKLCNEREKEISYDILTEPMKAKILHSKVDFQGHESSLYDIIGNDSKTLNILSPRQIRQILLHDIKLKISDNSIPSTNVFFVDRMFIEGSYSSKTIPNFRSIFSTQNILVKSHVLILSDSAGTGKTTTFMKNAMELKEEHKDYWISFINLRKHCDVFEKFKETKFDEHTLIKPFNRIKVQDILFDIIKQKSPLDREIFVKCFDIRKVLLFFDGFDEISPKYNELLLNILKIIKLLITHRCAWYPWRRKCECHEKHEWITGFLANRCKPGKETVLPSAIFISTRPHYKTLLEMSLDEPAYMFSPCNEYEIRNFITRMWEIKGLLPDESIPEKVIHYLTAEKSSPFISYEPYNNLLLIKLITSLFIKNPQLDITSMSLFEIFTSIVEGQKIELGNKVPNESCDILSTELTVWDIHSILALFVIIFNQFNEKFKFKFEDLAMVYDWIDEMGKLGDWTNGNEELVKPTYVWTPDVIQLYGFVCVDREFSKNSIDFTHKTYAEYFVARFIVRSFSNKHLRDEEVEKIFAILNFILTTNIIFDVVRNFIYSYMINEWKGKEFSNRFKGLLINKIADIHEKLKRGIAYEFISYDYICSGDEELSQMLWDTKTILSNTRDVEHNASLSDIQKSIFLHNSHRIIEIFERADVSMETNYFERFNQSGQALMTDEEIEQLRDTSQLSELWKQEKILLKFYDFADKNFQNSEKIKFINPQNLSSITSHKNLLELFVRFETSMPINEISVIFLRSVSFGSISDGLLHKFLEYVEPMCGSGLYQGQLMSELLGKIISSQHLKDFRSLTSYIAKHKNFRPNEELQKVIIDIPKNQFYGGFTAKMYPHFKDFILNSLENVDGIVNYMEDLVYRCLYRVYLNESEQENFADLYKIVYLGDEDKVRNIMREYNRIIHQIGTYQGKPLK